MGMDNQNLGCLVGQSGIIGSRQVLDIQGVLCAVGNIDPSRHGIAAFIGGNQCPGGDAVIFNVGGRVRRGCLYRRLRHRRRGLLALAGGRISLSRLLG